MRKFKVNQQTTQSVIKNARDKIKKQGGSPGEMNNKIKTQKKIISEATKKLKQLTKQFGKK